jgi:hypothetical protein
LADAVAVLLEEGIAIESENVINFALEEGGIPSGEDFVAHIKSRIGNPHTTVVLFTKNYLTSRFCLTELGTVWALSENMIPLIVPPLKEKHMKDLVAMNRLVRIDHPDDLNNLASLLQDKHGLKDMNLPRWAMEKKKFIGAVKLLAS